MEEADSLLGMLIPKEPTVEVEADQRTLPGCKQPIDDRTVIEELHTLNTQLRAFISQLLAQLEESEKQVEMLKARLQAYEDDSRPLPELAPLDMPQFDFSISSLTMFPPVIGNNES